MRTFTTPESPSGSPDTVEIPDKASEIENDSVVGPGAPTVKDALDLIWGLPPGGVASVFGRAGAVVAAIGDYLASQVNNDSTVPGVTVRNALDNLLAAIPAVPVSSVFGRVGAVVAALNDYAASQVNNDSSVAGATAKDALDNLLAAIPAVPVSSVFGRVGAVVAALNDYAASQVNNDSTVVGATVKDALDTLAGGGGAVSSVFGRVGAVVAALNDYAASQVNNDSTVVGATVKDALDTLAGGGGAVSSVFGRVGAVVAALNDYAASQVNNDSTVVGATVQAALDTLNTVATQIANGLMSAADKLKLDSLYPVAKLDNTNVWDALWLFEGNLNDSSGNGYTQAVGVGTARYTKFLSQYNAAGLTAISLGIDNCGLVATIPALRTTGDVTLALLLRPKAIGLTATTSFLFGCGQVGATQAVNFQYSIKTSVSAPTSTNPYLFAWNSEHGVGVQDNFNMTQTLPGPGDPMLMHWVREANVVKMYLNGMLLETSAALTTPDGGTSADIVLGTAGSGSFMGIPYDCACAAIKLSALDATAVSNDAKHVFGVS